MLAGVVHRQGESQVSRLQSLRHGGSAARLDQAGRQGQLEGMAAWEAGDGKRLRSFGQLLYLGGGQASYAIVARLGARPAARFGDLDSDGFGERGFGGPVRIAVAVARRHIGGRNAGRRAGRRCIGGARGVCQLIRQGALAHRRRSERRGKMGRLRLDIVVFVCGTSAAVDPRRVARHRSRRQQVWIRSVHSRAEMGLLSMRLGENEWCADGSRASWSS